MEGKQQKSFFQTWIFPALGVLTLLILMVGGIPYTPGYGFTRMTLAEFLWELWQADSDWAHGFYVPFISAALIYWKREELRHQPLQSHVGGLGLLLFSFFLYWIGYRAEQQYFGFAAIQLFLAGSALWFLGWPMSRSLIFPWLFLTFMWPLSFLDMMLAFPLRLAMSQMAAFALNSIGLATLQVGSALVSAPHPSQGIGEGTLFAVDIANPCSGLRSLFALLMIAALYGFLTFQETSKRLFLFLTAIPLAVVGNLVRILLLTLGSYWWGPHIAIGSLQEPTLYHKMAGYTVFLVALGGMLACSWLLQQIGGKPELPTPSPAQNLPPSLTLFRPSQTLIVLFLGGFTFFLCWITPPVQAAATTNVSMELPFRIGSYWGVDEEISLAERMLLPSDTQLVRKKYQSPAGDNILCSIVLAGAMKSSIHRPEVCLPGQGWTLDSRKRLPISFPNGEILYVTHLSLSRRLPHTSHPAKRLQAHYLYWFIGNGVTTPSHYQRVFLTHWDLLKNRTNHRWASITVSAPITEGLLSHGKNAKETLTLLKDFIRHAAPHLQKKTKNLPDS